VPACVSSVAMPQVSHRCQAPGAEAKTLDHFAINRS
jgi:hypothetical protein